MDELSEDILKAVVKIENIAQEAVGHMERLDF